MLFRSGVPKEVSVATRLTRTITLNTPLMTAAMDTVTEARMAIAIAREGGIGVIHKNMSIEEQADQVDRVKRSENGVIANPFYLSPEHFVYDADEIMGKYKISGVPICQDTGMAVVFLEIGQDVHIAGGDLTEAVNEGVRRGYDKGYLRKSVVKDPVRRGNTGDNTPAMLYTEIVPGEQIKITVGPKGFGSENMSAIRMFKPSAGIQGIKDFIL